MFRLAQLLTIINIFFLKSDRIFVDLCAYLFQKKERNLQLLYNIGGGNSKSVCVCVYGWFYRNIKLYQIALISHFN